MKKFYIFISLSLISLFANATVHNVYLSCIGVNPTITSAVCGDSIKWTWGGCSDSSRSTTIPACATAWAFPVNSSASIYTVVPCAGTYNFTCYCNTSYYPGTINVSCSLSATSSQINVLCNGGCTGSATVTANGGTSGYSYNWSPIGGTGPTVSSLCEGTYVCLITDASSGTTSVSVVITQPSAALTATHTQVDILCNGNCTGSVTINPSGGTPPYTYTNSSNLCAGTYFNFITDANGCSISIPVIITEPPPLIATKSQANVLCYGDCNGSATVTPSGGTLGYTYSWSPSGGTAATATGLCAGNFTCTIADAHGCTIAKTFLITQPMALSVSMTTVPSSCSTCCDGAATAIPSGGVPAYTFIWSPAVGFGSPVTNLCPGTYTCCVTDMNGCVSCDAAVVTFTTGINDPSAIGNLTVFPNPASQMITLDETFANATSAEISLINVLGQTVYTKHSGSAINLHETIDLSVLPNGVYFVSVKTNSGTAIRRFIKE